MSTIVPSDAAHGVSEWKLPIARTGLGKRSRSRSTVCSSATVRGRTSLWGVLTTPPS
jgi:hypothetical protein